MRLDGETLHHVQEQNCTNAEFFAATVKRQLRKLNSN